MDQDQDGDDAQNRRAKRSRVLLTARIRTKSGVIDARLRNLSQSGALLESQTMPATGSPVVFERGDTIVDARVAWAVDGRFGIEFLDPIEESEVLIHIGKPAPPPVTQPGKIFRRAGLRSETLSIGEQKFAEEWVNPGGRALD